MSWLVVATGALALVSGGLGFHIPRNDAFDALRRDQAATEWPGWFTAWVRGDHVRTACAVPAGLLLWSQR